MQRLASCVLLALTSTACVRWSPPVMSPSAAGSCRSGSLRWIAPADPEERKRLDSWCRGVGQAVVEWAPFNDRVPALGEITFVSWNVHVGNGDIRAFVKDLRAGLHTDNRKVGHFVMMLQEAVRTEGVPPFVDGASGAARIQAHIGGTIDIIQISQELGLSLIYVPSMRNGSSVEDPPADRGSAILSTVPLSEPVAVELPAERQRRVLVFAKLADLSIGVIHLDALGGAKRLWIFFTPWLREVQVRSAEALLKDGPLVLGADLNTWHGIDEQAVRFLKKLGRPTPVSLERHGSGLRVLDYLFFRAGDGRRAHYRQLARRYGSDHRPLVGWIE
ncbi:MAG TPA: endonuclease/exonuclease/phosphatase family protein [Vicinamibacterales bacterium]|nr:endonuclease/exonuclease/phosphatase family protein [Vicinamibacterales bacterium]